MEEPPPPPPPRPNGNQLPQEYPPFEYDRNRPAREQYNAFIDYAVGLQLFHRRNWMAHHPDHFEPGGMFDQNPQGEYRPLSPQSEDEEEFLNVEDREARIIQNIEEFLDEQALRRRFRMAMQHFELQEAEHPEINNNENFRNFNGMLSPSPSPSPSASPIPMDNDPAEEDPLAQARPDDEEVEMLNARMNNMQPHDSRPRKRHNSEGAGVVKRKRVTFKEESSDEAINSLDEDAPDFSDSSSRKEYDDDDEGFFGGPPAKHNSFCA